MSGADLSDPPGLTDVLTWLEKAADPAVRADLARYGIPQERALGIAMRDLKAKARELGRDQSLAEALWESGGYEARTLAAHIADPTAIAGKTVNRWVADFDNWAICDTVCFQLIDRTPFGWDRLPVWAKDERLYVRRAAFATIWALSVHDKAAADDAFRATFELIRAAATDDRPHVWKAVDMALRAIGKRNAALNAAALGLAEDLAAREDKTARRIGAKATRELSSEKVQARL